MAKSGTPSLHHSGEEWKGGSAAVSTLSLNHPPSLKLWRVSDLESWLYGMMQLREAATCGTPAEAQR